MLVLLLLAFSYFEIYAPGSDLYVIFLGAAVLLITKITADASADRGQVTINLSTGAKSVIWIGENVLLEAIYTALEENGGCIHFNDLKEHLGTRLGLKSISNIEGEELQRFLALQNARERLRFYGEWILGLEGMKSAIGIATIKKGMAMQRPAGRGRRRSLMAGVLEYNSADLGSYRKLRRREGATLLLLPGRNASRKLVEDIAHCRPTGLVAAALICCRFAKVVYC